MSNETCYLDELDESTQKKVKGDRLVNRGERNVVYIGGKTLDENGEPLCDDETFVGKLFGLKNKYSNGYFTKDRKKVDEVKKAIQDQIESLNDFLNCEQFRKSINLRIAEAKSLLLKLSTDISSKVVNNLIFDNGNEVLKTINDSIEIVGSKELLVCFNENEIISKKLNLEMSMMPSICFDYADKIMAICRSVCKDTTGRIKPQIREIRRQAKKILDIGCDPDNKFISRYDYFYEERILREFVIAYKNF